MGFALVVCQLSLGADDSEDKLFAHGSHSALLHKTDRSHTLQKNPRAERFISV